MLIQQNYADHGDPVKENRHKPEASSAKYFTANDTNYNITISFNFLMKKLNHTR